MAGGKSRTVLAPSNTAFDKLSVDAVECLLRSENEHLLQQLVLIHIGSPAEYEVTLAQRSKFYTFNTRYFLYVRVENGNVVITNSRIPFQEADIPANNGVIHVLPDVIVPPEVDFDKLNCPAPASASTADTTAAASDGTTAAASDGTTAAVPSPSDGTTTVSPTTSDPTGVSDVFGDLN